MPLNSFEMQFLLNFTHKKDETPPTSPIRRQEHPLSAAGLSGLHDHSFPDTPVIGVSTRLAPTSFKEALMQDMAEEETIPLPVLEDDLEMEHTKDGVAAPTEQIIPLPSHVRKKIYAPRKSSIIVKVAGKLFGYKALLTRLTSFWCPKGNLNIIDLGHEFFLVKFTLATDYLNVLERGPWFVGENYLSMHKWEPEFQAAKAKVASLVAWIRLPDLPIEFFHHDILCTIGNKIRRFVKMDTITNTVARGSVAVPRIFLKVFLKKHKLHNLIKREIHILKIGRAHV